MTKWDATTQAGLTLNADAPTWLGVDKSAYNDCSAVVALQRDGGRWLAIAHVFTPQVTSGRATIDHRAVNDLIRELCATYNVEAVGYDPRYMVEGAAQLEDDGVPMLEVAQSHERMGPAYSLLQRSIFDHELIHDADNEYRRHILSAVLSTKSHNGSIMLSKRASAYKIDACAATAIAMSASGLADPPRVITAESMFL